MNEPLNIPHVVASADGLPLTADNVSIDFGFEIPGIEGWATPLKLTK